MKNSSSWSRAQRKRASRRMKKTWREHRDIMLQGARKGRRRVDQKGRIEASLVSRSTEERSRSMKRTWRKKRSVMLRGARLGARLGRKIQKKDPLLRKKFGERIKRKWRTDKIFRDMVINKNLALGRERPSKLQVSVFKRLRKKSKLSLKLDFRVERYLLDIACPENKKAVELDCVYWHSLKHRNSRRRWRVLRERGWKILHVRVTRKDISEGQFLRCKEFLL